MVGSSSHSGRTLLNRGFHISRLLHTRLSITVLQKESTVMWLRRASPWCLKPQCLKRTGHLHLRLRCTWLIVSQLQILIISLRIRSCSSDRQITTGCGSLALSVSPGYVPTLQIKWKIDQKSVCFLVTQQAKVLTCVFIDPQAGSTRLDMWSLKSRFFPSLLHRRVRWS